VLADHQGGGSQGRVNLSGLACPLLALLGRTYIHVISFQRSIPDIRRSDARVRSTLVVEILCRRGGRGDTVSVRPTTKT
jgi:hypothetical protein